MSGIKLSELTDEVYLSGVLNYFYFIFTMTEIIDDIYEKIRDGLCERIFRYNHFYNYVNKTEISKKDQDRYFDRLKWLCDYSCTFKKIITTLRNQYNILEKENERKSKFSKLDQGGMILILTRDFIRIKNLHYDYVFKLGDVNGLNLQHTILFNLGLYSFDYHIDLNPLVQKSIDHYVSIITSPNFSEYKSNSLTFDLLSPIFLTHGLIQLEKIFNLPSLSTLDKILNETFSVKSSLYFPKTNKFVQDICSSCLSGTIIYSPRKNNNGHRCSNEYCDVVTKFKHTILGITAQINNKDGIINCHTKKSLKIYCHIPINKVIERVDDDILIQEIKRRKLNINN